MADETEHKRNKATSGSKSSPSEKGGSSTKNAQEWGGGTKGSKGPITEADKRNPNSSAKS